MQTQRIHRSRAFMFPTDMFERWEGELSNSCRILQDGKKYWVRRRDGKWFGEENNGTSLNGKIGYSSRDKAARACSAAASNNLHGS